jgi:ribosomal protein S18 acetylase RimI-like enzyme
MSAADFTPPPSGLVLAREPFTPTLLAELRSLILANHKATGSSSPLDPNWDGIAYLGDHGAMALVVVRFNDKPVGYAAQVMQVHHLYGERWAVCLAIYLMPAYRRHFRKLADEMERIAREAGAAVLSYSVPRRDGLLSAVGTFERLGFRAAEVMMAKRLQ